MQDISDDVQQFTKGCERLISALVQHTQLSETEKNLISYYYEELSALTQSLRVENNNLEQQHGEPYLAEDDTLYVAGHG